MKDIWQVSFDVPTGSSVRVRRVLKACSLADIARAIGPLCIVKVPAGDTRIGELKNQLGEFGITASTRVTRHFTKRDLDRASWLKCKIRTVGVSGGATCGEQEFDWTGACPECGAGAVPSPLLLVELWRMGKKKVDATAHDGHIVVTSSVAKALRKARITGFELRGVRRPHLQRPDRDYRWLHVTSTWPPMEPTRVLEVDDLCPKCRRTGHFDSAARPSEFHYSHVPTQTADINTTWERFGYWRGPGFRGPGVGGMAGVIVSQKVRQVFSEQGVRLLDYVPVVFTGGTQSPGRRRTSSCN
jgi:hypothetical protein